MGSRWYEPVSLFDSSFVELKKAGRVQPRVSREGGGERVRHLLTSLSLIPLPFNPSDVRYLPFPFFSFPTTSNSHRHLSLTLIVGPNDPPTTLHTLAAFAHTKPQFTKQHSVTMFKAFAIVALAFSALVNGQSSLTIASPVSLSSSSELHLDTELTDVSCIYSIRRPRCSPVTASQTQLASPFPTPNLSSLLTRYRISSGISRPMS